MNPSKRIVLIAGMGTSPAVLTETVWALAHQAESVVPDETVRPGVRLENETVWLTQEQIIQKGPALLPRVN